MAAGLPRARRCRWSRSGLRPWEPSACDETGTTAAEPLGFRGWGEWRIGRGEWRVANGEEATYSPRLVAIPYSLFATRQLFATRHLLPNPSFWGRFCPWLP